MSDKFLNKIGLGTWAFGGRAYGPMDDHVSADVAKKAYELGVRFFDTASIYASGKSESILGTSLASFQDAKFCTKIGYDISSGKPVKNYDLKFLEASLLSSMQRLNRNYIDLLLLHNPPTEVLEQSEIYKWLNSKIKDGTVLQWGVSVYDSVQDAKLALNEGAQAIEARYSLLRRDIIGELPKNQWSFQFIARSPLDGGLLSGKYTGNEIFPSTDQRSAQKSEYIKTNHSFIKELQPLLDQDIVGSFPELAIRFTAFSPNVSVVIPGAKSVIQVEENVSAVKKGPLPPSAIQLIDNLREKYLHVISS